MAWGCSCVGKPTACTDLKDPWIVFVGRVLTTSEGGYRARIAIEEPLLNVPSGLREIAADSGEPCGFGELKAGETYAIFVYPEHRWGGVFRISMCSSTFNVRDRGYLLDALRNQLKGGVPRLVGTIFPQTIRSSPEGNGLAGVTLTLRGTVGGHGVTREATTAAGGHYEFRALAPGRYSVEATKPGYFSEANPELVVKEKQCGIWYGSLWPNGTISGTVRGPDGRILRDVEIEAIELDKKGEPRSKLRSFTTRADGTYTLEKLPEGSYLVGVNAEPGRNENAYPTVTVPAQLGDHQALRNVNLVIPKERPATQVRVQVLWPGGRPYAGIYVRLESQGDPPRLYGFIQTDLAGGAEFEVYLGERYRLTAFDTPYWMENGGSVNFEGSKNFVVRTPAPRVTIQLHSRVF